MNRQTCLALTTLAMAGVMLACAVIQPGAQTSRQQRKTKARSNATIKLMKKGLRAGRTSNKPVLRQGAAAAGGPTMAINAYVPPPQLVPGVNYGAPNYSNSPILRKFVNSLPGLGLAAANDLGQYIPVAVPDTTSFLGTDYYEIALVQYREQLHSDLPAVSGLSKVDPNATGGTLLRGYVQEMNGVPVTEPHYLGPLILAQKGRPVRIKFTNRLPVGAAGNLFIPTDVTVMGAGTGPNGGSYTQNRATLHLHGGDNPWISDGTAHQWITPASENTPYTKGVSQQNVPDMPLPAGGSATFYWPNGQSGRLMFYHDHAYGTTRLDVYAGEAAGYLLTDPDEQSLTPAGGQIPLVIQDKTFVNDGTFPAEFALTGGVATSPTSVVDPLWSDAATNPDAANWGQAKGSLWLPHVYMPNQNPNDLTGANPMGRWDYGPWFWPVFPVSFNLPMTSIVPESFMDTPLVNGTAYPYVNVQPKAYRFRILNACNDRYLNLQLYVADPTVTTADGRASTEVRMVPAYGPAPLSIDPTVTSWPSWWNGYGGIGVLNDIIDARAGGVPDPGLMGPSFIQIGTEGGILPAPVVLQNTPVGYELNKRSVTVLNVLEHTLWLGPAERGDVIVDFSQFAGKTLILYNDAPAPLPAGDPRYDYYTGDLDQTGSGGAPITMPGFGPNTRTIMQIRVAAATPDAPFDPNSLAAPLSAAFAKTQPASVVPPNTFARISDTSMTFTAPSVTSISVTNQGSGYTAAPAVTISAPTTPGGRTATATATLTAGTVTAITVTDGGSGYTALPTVTIDPPAAGTQATATAVMTPVTYNLLPKTIQELFDPFGRMNATLGVEIPFTTATVQTTIPYGFTDPATEVIPDGAVQLWKITHNGVDTHAIHFHLFNVQVVNRVGWDGAIKPPYADEYGWKDTVKMNPLEDIVVALRAKVPAVPFAQPDNVRPLDPASPANFLFTGVVDPNGNPVANFINATVNFGNEYTWHCHLLGHEENDMMRPIMVAVPPAAPTGLSVILSPSSTAVLSWTPSKTNSVAVQTVQRASNSTFTSGLVAWDVAANAASFTDASYKASNVPYYYRVLAKTVVGSGVAGFPSITQTAASNVAGPPSAILTASVSQAATKASPVVVKWTVQAGTNGYTGFTVQRATNSTFTTGLSQFKVGATATSYSDTGTKAGTLYYYRVIPTNVLGNGAPSNTVSITPHA